MMYQCVLGTAGHRNLHYAFLIYSASYLLCSVFVKHLCAAIVSFQCAGDGNIVLISQIRELRLEEVKFSAELQKHKDSLWTVFSYIPSSQHSITMRV